MTSSSLCWKNLREKVQAKEQAGEEWRSGTHSLMDSAVTIEVAEAEADVVPVFGDIGRRAPHVPVHANIIQGVWATQPAKDKTQDC